MDGLQTEDAGTDFQSRGPALASELCDSIELLRTGDEAAFQTLVHRTTPRLLAVARRFLRNEEEARDVVQETFLSAFRSIGRFRVGSRIETWLYRIAVNHCLMRLRSRRRKPEQPIDEHAPDGQQACTVGQTPLEILESGQTLQLVHAAIKRLPETYSSVLWLRDIEELGTAETAEHLGISANATKVRLHRARQALRELLEPHFTAERREEPATRVGPHRDRSRGWPRRCPPPFLRQQASPH